ncbi:MAG: hypothetical protein WBG58_17860, partial [Ignavibacteriaceae bacterium]
MNNTNSEEESMDQFTRELFEDLFSPADQKIIETPKVPEKLALEIDALFTSTKDTERTGPVIDLFSRLKKIKKELNISPDALGISKEALTMLAVKHRHLDEHGVTVGGRINRALPIVEQANERVVNYLKNKDTEAPSGIELWDSIQENVRRIKLILNIADEEWNSYSGQLKHCIDSVEKLSKIIDLPSQIIEELSRVTKSYRMRLTPYYASLIQPD